MQFLTKKAMKQLNIATILLIHKGIDQIYFISRKNQNKNKC